MFRNELHIFGRVQGVLFRAAARRRAKKLGLSGWIRNEEDGSVSAIVEGNEPALDAFTRWCHRGPPLARVDRILVERKQAVEEFAEFRVL